jgi:hypothetical protein
MAAPSGKRPAETIIEIDGSANEERKTARRMIDLDAEEAVALKPSNSEDFLRNVHAEVFQRSEKYVPKDVLPMCDQVFLPSHPIAAIEKNFSDNENEHPFANDSYIDFAIRHVLCPERYGVCVIGSQTVTRICSGSYYKTLEDLAIHFHTFDCSHLVPSMFPLLESTVPVPFRVITFIINVTDVHWSLAAMYIPLQFDNEGKLTLYLFDSFTAKDLALPTTEKLATELCRIGFLDRGGRTQLEVKRVAEFGAQKGITCASWTLRALELICHLAHRQVYAPPDEERMRYIDRDDSVLSFYRSIRLGYMTLRCLFMPYYIKRVEFHRNNPGKPLDPELDKQLFNQTTWSRLEHFWKQHDRQPPFPKEVIRSFFKLMKDPVTNNDQYPSVTPATLRTFISSVFIPEDSARLLVAFEPQDIVAAQQDRIRRLKDGSASESHRCSFYSVLIRTLHTEVALFVQYTRFNPIKSTLQLGPIVIYSIANLTPQALQLHFVKERFGIQETKEEQQRRASPMKARFVEDEAMLRETVVQLYRGFGFADSAVPPQDALQLVSLKGECANYNFLLGIHLLRCLMNDPDQFPRTTSGILQLFCSQRPAAFTRDIFLQYRIAMMYALYGFGIYQDRGSPYLGARTSLLKAKNDVRFESRDPAWSPEKIAALYEMDIWNRIIPVCRGMYLNTSAAQWLSQIDMLMRFRDDVRKAAASPDRDGIRTALQNPTYDSFGVIPVATLGSPTSSPEEYLATNSAVQLRMGARTTDVLKQPLNNWYDTMTLLTAEDLELLVTNDRQLLHHLYCIPFPVLLRFGKQSNVTVPMTILDVLARLLYSPRTSPGALQQLASLSQPQLYEQLAAYGIQPRFCFTNSTPWLVLHVEGDYEARLAPGSIASHEETMCVGQLGPLGEKSEQGWFLDKKTGLPQAFNDYGPLNKMPDPLLNNRPATDLFLMALLSYIRAVSHHC